MSDLVDVHVPAAPGSLMRSHVIDRPGRFRLARRDCELYSVQILNAGDWARAKCLAGSGRGIWYQPSTFTGSFWLSAGCEEGLIFELFALNCGIFAINWREPDRKVV
jgi:hypothetical protein